MAEFDPSAKRERVIQWDEEAIAEHDKERGTRQKIDEPPTPYRYSSESDQSEYESGSEYERDVRAKKKSHPLSNSPVIASQMTGVMQSWEELQAQLHYQQSLQEHSDAAFVHSQSCTTSDSQFGQNSKIGYLESPSIADGTKSYGTSHDCKVVSRGRVKTTQPVEDDHRAMEGDDEGGDDDEDDLNTSGVVIEGVEGSKGSGSKGSVSNSTASTVDDMKFKSRRAAHYSEFKVLQALKSKMNYSDDDDDNDTSK